jgi:3-hydroxybutyryl-CoA dehydrogenase
MNLKAEVVGVVGAGAMGKGIAQVAAVSGAKVLLIDNREGVAAAAKSDIKSVLERLV